MRSRGRKKGNPSSRSEETPKLDASFTFRFRSNSSLEPNCAIADVRSGSATIWGSLKSPVVAQENIALELGLPVSKVKVHVTQGGGSFGRKLFHDAALEAARISKAMGKPVRLMWHRADEPRQGRLHPLATSRVRAAYLGGDVLSFEQKHTSVTTDFGHGLGDLPPAVGDRGERPAPVLRVRQPLHQPGRREQAARGEADVGRFPPAHRAPPPAASPWPSAPWPRPI